MTAAPDLRRIAYFAPVRAGADWSPGPHVVCGNGHKKDIPNAWPSSNRCWCGEYRHTIDGKPFIIRLKRTGPPSSD